MQEYSIVTLQCTAKKVSIDVELPLSAPFYTYRSSVEQALMSMLRVSASTPKGLRFFFNETEIKPQQSLAELGAWDGSILVVKG